MIVKQLVAVAFPHHPAVFLYFSLQLSVAPSCIPCKKADMAFYRIALKDILFQFSEVAVQVKFIVEFQRAFERIDRMNEKDGVPADRPPP